MCSKYFLLPLKLKTRCNIIIILGFYSENSIFFCGTHNLFSLKYGYLCMYKGMQIEHYHIKYYFQGFIIIFMLTIQVFVRYLYC